MKSVLISIQPKWCELIASGDKTIEVRKTRPKIKTPLKCYIYCTLDGGMKGDMIHALGGDTIVTCGKVIGEFVCDSMFDFIQAGAGIMFAQGDNQLDPKISLRLSCLSEKEIDDYLGDKDGYGWHISNLVIYDKPKELSEFCVKRAPQSWQFVEELK